MPQRISKRSALITHALLGHYHAELHEAEAPPEDMQSQFFFVARGFRRGS